MVQRHCFVIFVFVIVLIAFLCHLYIAEIPAEFCNPVIPGLVASNPGIYAINECRDPGRILQFRPPGIGSVQSRNLRD